MEIQAKYYLAFKCLLLFGFYKKILGTVTKRNYPVVSPDPEQQTFLYKKTDIS